MNLELIHDLWMPNIFIYNLKTFQVIDVLSKLAGLWINNKKEVYYRYVLRFTLTQFLNYIDNYILLPAKPRTSLSYVLCYLTRSRWIRKSASSR